MEPIRPDGAMTAHPAVLRETAAALAEEAAMPALHDRRTQPRDRRMHLRAYNHWASMLDRRRFPSVADLANGALGDIAPHSVLLDVSESAHGPSIAYLGERLATECGAGEATLQRLADAPEGSLLARLTGHYETVLLNRAPTGFEAEFTGLRGLMLLYRGILLPFSSDDTTIDFVLAVINWKEEAESSPDRPVLVEQTPACRRTPSAALLTNWADGPIQSADLPEHGFPSDAAHSDPSLESLRLLPLQPFAALPSEGAEFALAIIRRPASGAPALLGEVPHDPALIEQAARLLAR